MLRGACHFQPLLLNNKELTLSPGICQITTRCSDWFQINDTENIFFILQISLLKSF